MTRKNKQLLLNDLSARLPYGVLCSMGLDYPLPLQRLFIDKLDGILLDFYENGKDYQVYLSEVKPYLRPLSSMTKEEKKIQKEYIYHFSGNNLPHYEGDFVFEDEVHEYIDWLNAHHFDYRGLIEKGLALEATSETYNKE